MLFSSLLVLSLLPRLTSAESVRSGTSTTNGPLLLPTGGSNHGLDLGHIGSTIGGASAAAIAVILIALIFAARRWSRGRHCLHHNKELGEIVPSLEYRKRNVDIETASVDSFEELQFPIPALLPAASQMHEAHFRPPPSYFPQVSNRAQPPAQDLLPS